MTYDYAKIYHKVDPSMDKMNGISESITVIQP